MHVSIVAETLFRFAGIPITNSFFANLAVSLLLIVVAFLVYSSSKLVPDIFQNIVEAVIEPLYSLVVEVAGDRARDFFPLVATLFLFILFSNWTGLVSTVVPGAGQVGLIKEGYSEDGAGRAAFVPLFRGGTADLNATVALALVSVVAIQYYGIRHLGLTLHLKKFINLSGPIEFFIGILELISEFAKIISFAFRLFGNIFAGEVLLVVVTGLVPILAPLPFIGLELFVGVVQALVFAVLTLAFINIATLEHQGAY